MPTLLHLYAEDDIQQKLETAVRNGKVNALVSLINFPGLIYHNLPGTSGRNGNTDNNGTQEPFTKSLELKGTLTLGPVTLYCSKA